MKLYLKAFSVTLTVALGLAGLFWMWRQNSVGQTPVRIAQIENMETQGVPNFEVQSLDGKTVELEDFKGQVVIVGFWASWCGPCVEEFPSMIELVEKMGGQVKLLAISQDSSREDIEAFLKSFPKSKENQNIQILWDENHKVGQMFNVDRLPESFIVGKDQRLVRRIVGSIDWASKDAIAFMQELTKK